MNSKTNRATNMARCREEEGAVVALEGAGAEQSNASGGAAGWAVRGDGGCGGWPAQSQQRPEV